jgi:phospholipid/cholesterol/gamma-HCH transport system permease protein
MIETGLLKVIEADGAIVLRAAGRWDIASAAVLDRLLRDIRPAPGKMHRLDLSAVDRLDTTGAWLIQRTMGQLSGRGIEVELTGVADTQSVLLNQLAEFDGVADREPRKRRGLARVAERTGKGTVYLGEKSRNFIGFLGLLTVALLRVAAQPRRLRLNALVYQMELTGFTALPIVGLISFLIGIVMAYQGATQLQQFGAQIFVVNLIAISVLRELGNMLTAIVVAGRSGSAFTAQIGAMKVNQEVDAMRALGLDPIEVLVVPRVLALVLVMPLLGFFADIMGLMGGALMSWVVLDISPAQFLTRLQEAAGFWTVMTGLIKAPVFALMVGMVGCYEGLRVEGSAESVGRLTTRSVVESIFLVIVVDALFSIFFSFIGI